MYRPSVIIVSICFLYLVIVLFTLATDKTRFLDSHWNKKNHESSFPDNEITKRYIRFGDIRKVAWIQDKYEWKCLLLYRT